MILRGALASGTSRVLRRLLGVLLGLEFRGRNSWLRDIAVVLFMALVTALIVGVLLQGFRAGD
ncbi:MAG: hypothetical protein JSW71_19440 [Gemmatimonadota bacterium]|nr:MAG: hypothetical protein JSW71_19440 [Gemmatimonadota bacterium]